MQDFIRDFNTERRAMKDKWVVFLGTCNGKEVAIKSYNTWVQVIVIDGVRDSGPSDCNVGELNAWLASVLPGEDDDETDS